MKNPTHALFPLLFGILAIVSGLTCSKEVRVTEPVQPSIHSVLQGPSSTHSSGCAGTFSTGSTVLCWGYASVRALRYWDPVEYCSWPYNIAVNGMVVGGFQQYSWSLQNVQIGDVVDVGGPGNHVVYVVNPGNRSSLASVIIADANRQLGGPPGEVLDVGESLQDVFDQFEEALGSGFSATQPVYIYRYTCSGSSGSCPVLPPVPPYPISPSNGVTNVPLGETAFTWSVPYSQATIVSYQLQIDDQSTFTSPLVLDTTVSEASVYGITLPLYGTQYHWRVRAKNSGNINWSEPSTTFNFTTQSIITVTMPVTNDKYNTSETIEIEWSKAGSSFTTATIWFSTNSGSNWTQQVSGVSHTTNMPYLLTNPGTVTATARIKVSDPGNGVYGTSGIFVNGPALSISGPSSLPNGSGSTWSVTPSPSGSYTYKWYRSVWPGSNFTYQGSGTSYSGNVNGGHFQLKVEAWSGSTFLSSSTKIITCSNCGGGDP